MTKYISNPEAIYRTALHDFQSGDYQQARKLLSRLARLDPLHAGVLRILGASCCELGRHDEAITHLSIVAEREKTASDFSNLGKALHLAMRLEEALNAFAVGLSSAPKNAQLLQGKASVLNALGRFDEAIEGYLEVFSSDQKSVEAHFNLAALYMRRSRSAEALEHLEQALKSAPNDAELLSARLRAKQIMCDWNGIDDAINQLSQLAKSGQKVEPFTLLTIVDSPEIHFKAAQTRAASLRKYLSQGALPPLKPAKHSSRIRLAYISADFRNHPTSRLIAGIFETHNRTNFEITAISTSIDDGSELRKQVEKSVDQFIDASLFSPEQIVSILRQKKCDIAIDMMGFTRDAISKLFIMRAAPIQVNYLGYPGTTAIAEMDYIIIDHTIGSPKICENLIEKPVFMPNCYQPNDRKRLRPEAKFTKSELGLSLGKQEADIVLCCFNNTGKITHHIFNAWMRILKATPSSILWLYVLDDIAFKNLQAAASQQGIDSNRIVRALKMDQQDHLSRYLLADLALDTSPYGSHTTGSDALWMGCPLLTIEGETFASRVGASLLRAVNLPELIVKTLSDYEQSAIALSQDKQARTMLRQKLADERDSAPLFDTLKYTRNLEHAYMEMHRKRLQGKKPMPIDISAIISPI